MRLGRVEIAGLDQQVAQPAPGGGTLFLADGTNRIRAVPGVMNTETFIYLDLVKQTFTWGAH